ncbi:MAG TPA: YhjD/YihY/BrkB family envelope integrity protein [Gaiellaceae bacterium]|nr:YhjD/YihY/BrkB family envelope integrity protein [Gaiellaceae bacterium]
MARVRAKFGTASKRAQDWVERQDPGSGRGVAIGAWRRYRAVEGPLQTALLSLYILVAVLPALLVMEEYLDPHPNSLANSIVHHYRLNAPTSELIHNVLGEGRSHELGSALFAIAGALVFGIGFGHVLQLVYARAWQLELKTGVSDQLGYGAVLAGLYGLLLLLLVQLNDFHPRSAVVKVLLGIGWLGFLMLFFVVVPWLLTHKQIPPRELLPGAALIAVGLVALMVVSRYVMQYWVDLYARDYGGLGVVLAIYFWIAICAGIIVWAASLSPALAERREVRRDASVDTLPQAPHGG